MKKLSIVASDGKNQLIEPETNAPMIIGFQYVDDSKQFLEQGKSRPLMIVELFFNSNFSDFFYFSADGKLLFNSVSERRKSFERKLYLEVTKVPGIDRNVFLNHITSCWSGFKLGFFDEATFER